MHSPEGGGRGQRRRTIRAWSSVFLRKGTWLTAHPPYLQCLDASAANQGLQLGIDATEAAETVNRDTSELGQRKGTGER